MNSRNGYSFEFIFTAEINGLNGIEGTGNGDVHLHRPNHLDHMR
jgi:hypothetical protein